MTESPQIWKRWLLFFVVIFIAMLFIFWAQEKLRKPKSVVLQNGTYISKPINLTKFNLISSDNEPLDNDSLIGHWTLIFFGFTHCPAICPTTLAQLNQAYHKIPEGSRPDILFISVDPERDTPQIIANYLKNFNPEFNGATGSLDEITALTKQLGIAFMKAKKSGEQNYQIEHSGAILVINPNGKWVGLLSPPQTGASIAADFLTIRHANGDW